MVHNAGHALAAHNVLDYTWGIGDSEKGPHIAHRLLRLTRGKTYFFHVTQPFTGGPHRFYFTADPVGGSVAALKFPGVDIAPKILGSPEPISNGVMVLHISESCPTIFYWQDRFSPFMGGIVLVRNPVRS